jgi:hypothetical protein
MIPLVYNLERPGTLARPWLQSVRRHRGRLRGDLALATGSRPLVASGDRISSGGRKQLGLDSSVTLDQLRALEDASRWRTARDRSSARGGGNRCLALQKTGTEANVQVRE